MELCKCVVGTTQNKPLVYFCSYRVRLGINFALKGVVCVCVFDIKIQGMVLMYQIARLITANDCLLTLSCQSSQVPKYCLHRVHGC